jgi:hypothetical protein
MNKHLIISYSFSVPGYIYFIEKIRQSQSCELSSCENKTLIGLLINAIMGVMFSPMPLVFLKSTWIHLPHRKKIAVAVLQAFLMWKQNPNWFANKCNSGW